MHLLPYVIAWGVLAVIVVLLALYRRTIASHEDDSLHVSDPGGAVVAQQALLARRLERIDRWGKILTVIALVAGLALAGAYLYHGWVESLQWRG